MPRRNMRDFRWLFAVAVGIATCLVCTMSWVLRGRGDFCHAPVGWWPGELPSGVSGALAGGAMASARALAPRAVPPQWARNVPLAENLWKRAFSTVPATASRGAARSGPVRDRLYCSVCVKRSFRQRTGLVCIRSNARPAGRTGIADVRPNARLDFFT